MLHLETIHPDTFSLLNVLCEQPELKDFRLCGGTSLALQIGHRISVDLDFFGMPDFPFPENLLQLKIPGIEIKENYSSQKIYSCFMNGVKVDFVHYRYPWIASEIHFESARLCGLEEIAAMKLEAIKGRGRKRDFFDLYYLLQSLSLDKCLELNLKKFSKSDQSLILRSLSYFEDAEEDEDPVLLKEKLSWSEVKDQIRDSIRNYMKEQGF